MRILSKLEICQYGCENLNMCGEAFFQPSGLVVPLETETVNNSKIYQSPLKRNFCTTEFMFKRGISQLLFLPVAYRMNKAYLVFFNIVFLLS